MKKETTAQKLETNLAQMVVSARKLSRTTQVKLAEKLKTKQPSIARLEKNGFSVKMAERALSAMGFKLGFHHVSFGTDRKKQTYFLGGIE